MSSLIILETGIVLHGIFEKISTMKGMHYRFIADRKTEIRSIDDITEDIQCCELWVYNYCIDDGNMEKWTIKDFEHKRYNSDIPRTILEKIYIFLGAKLDEIIIFNIEPIKKK